MSFYNGTVKTVTRKFFTCFKSIALDTKLNKSRMKILKLTLPVQNNVSKSKLQNISSYKKTAFNGYLYQNVIVFPAMIMYG